MSIRSSSTGPWARTTTRRIRRQPRKITEVEGLATAVARHLQGERRRAAVLGLPRLAEPFPVHRLAGAITRQLGDPWRSFRLPARDLASAISSKLGRGGGNVAIPAVLRAIVHELHRQE
jgi:hypothetical protein